MAGNQYNLKRSGTAPLAFTGELLAESSGLQLHKGTDKPGKRDSWHEARVYKTEGGNWIVEITFQSSFRHEHPAWYAEAFETPQEARNALESYDPSKDVRGYPADHPGREEKQRALLEAARERFDAILTDLFSQVPEFADRVD